MGQSKAQNIEIRIMGGFEGFGISTNPKFFKLPLPVDTTKVAHGDSFLGLSGLVLPRLSQFSSGPKPLFPNLHLKLITRVRFQNIQLCCLP